MEGALHPKRVTVNGDQEQRARNVAERTGSRLFHVATVAKDGARLSAWSIRPSVGNGDAVILLHGQGDNRAGMLGPAQMLLRHGYMVLLPDSRAHGMSGGSIAAYGVLEADDIRRWVEWLRQNDAPHCIDGLGDSMGGAEVLESLSSGAGFCAVVAESPFATFGEAAYDRLGQEFSAGAWLGRSLLRPAAVAGIEYARLRYGIDFRHASPASAVASSQVPVLLIHGLGDTNLPPRHSELIQAANPRVSLWEPKGAGHCGASSAAPAEYERQVVTWFGEHHPLESMTR